MITKTEDRHAKRKEAIEGKKEIPNKSKSWRRRRTT
jgi:hypothetical protein|tara:strand:- start:1004 stop:1111 length:108 start_codon:yes stop_codon:yes gene_type:complete